MAENVDELCVAVQDNGWVIVPGFMTEHDQLRESLKQIVASTQSQGTIEWHPYLGMENGWCISKNKFEKMIRYYDFDWNSSDIPELRDLMSRIEYTTRELTLRLSGQEMPAKSQRYYGSMTWYQGGGELGWHSDTLVSGQLIHGLVLLTTRGTDFESGGLMIRDRNGAEIDVEAVAQAGDLIVYDGALEHRVKKIEVSEGQFGRCQCLPIKTKFVAPQNSQSMIRRVSSRALAYELIRRLPRAVRQRSTS